ncbi:hexokinase-1-like isoform X3 [Lineus longissimus]|uniref:hexokinase-1-like isoform X3 n=1 Tax=Lineus longissimus TaxID=88925 RepID=UPI00315DF84C
MGRLSLDTYSHEGMGNIEGSQGKDILEETVKFNSALESINKVLQLTSDQYKDVMRVMDEEMSKGLGKDSHKDASVKMFPTYVRNIPDGTEEGNFLALDLGGTNFRVLLISLRKDHDVSMKSRIYPISQETMTGPGTQLFDHIAECISNFVKENKLKDLQLPLGFTFSFPCEQRGLAKGHLVRWTKGFTCKGVEGEDVVRLLHEAIERRKDLNVECLAVINDTVGTLMACAYDDNDCKIGLILGTGTNACYMETLSRVERWDESLDEQPQQSPPHSPKITEFLNKLKIGGKRRTELVNGQPYVIINTEWGAFGDSGCLDFIRTEYDADVDKHSHNPGQQLFEKMISGMYMGEIVRLVLVKLAEDGHIFKGEVTEDLDTRERFYTKYVSEIESDIVNSEKNKKAEKENTDQFENTRHILKELGYDEATDEDFQAVQKVCALVSSRAAYLSAAGVAALLNRIDSPQTTVGVDGSLFRYHPRFGDLMSQKIEELKPENKCKLMLSSDGSGKGAALVAAVAYRVKLQQHSSS